MSTFFILLKCKNASYCYSSILKPWCLLMHSLLLELSRHNLCGLILSDPSFMCICLRKLKSLVDVEAQHTPVPRAGNVNSTKLQRSLLPSELLPTKPQMILKSLLTGMMMLPVGQGGWNFKMYHLLYIQPEPRDHGFLRHLSTTPLSTIIKIKSDQKDENIDENEADDKKHKIWFRSTRQVKRRVVELTRSLKIRVYPNAAQKELLKMWMDVRGWSTTWWSRTTIIVTVLPNSSSSDLF